MQVYDQNLICIESLHIKWHLMKIKYVEHILQDILPTRIVGMYTLGRYGIFIPICV